jgi:hypothetical protein
MLVVAEERTQSRCADRSWSVFALLVGDRPVLDAPRHDDELALADQHFAAAELHPQAAPHDQEKLVLVGAVAPDELAQQLDELHVLPLSSPTTLGRQCSANSPNFSARLTATGV